MACMKVAKPPHKPNISVGFDFGIHPQNLKLLPFLLSFENRLKFRIGDIHFDLVAKAFCLAVHSRTNYYFGVGTG